MEYLINDEVIIENNTREEIGCETITVEAFSKALNLKIVYEGRGSLDLKSISVCRPGLQLAGYFKHFDSKRVQVIGKAENEFLRSSQPITKRACLNELFKTGIPCLIFARNLAIDEEFITTAKTYNCPIFLSDKITTVLINDLTKYQNEQLAPTDVVHGVFMDIYGLGVLITGKSGVGKSEIALDLINRGHRLIADDSVIFKLINEKIIGKAPERIRYFMEVRGVGIINVQQMFGPGAIRPGGGLDMIVNLEPWSEETNYDRLGNEEEYKEMLGKQILNLNIPVSPGRNVPIILETAVMKLRLKQAGVDATRDLMSRVFGENK